MKVKVVSIIMPAFNAELFIRYSIQSVIDQTYEDWELIIIDDGSSDNTLKIAKEFQYDFRIKIISQRNTGLPAAARNAGIKKAVGDWIAFLDADDLWTADKLQTQINFINQNNHVDFIYSGGWVINGDQFAHMQEYETKFGEFDGRKMYKQLYGSNCIPIVSVLLKRDLIYKIGPQSEDSDIRGCEDLDYWFKCALLNTVFYGLKSNLFYYRKNENSVSSNKAKMVISLINVLLRNYKENLISKKLSLKIIKTHFQFHISSILADLDNPYVKQTLYKINHFFTDGYFKIVKLVLSWKIKSRFMHKILIKIDSLI